MGKVLTLVIVNYNQGNYFEDCIRSVKEQNLINPQLIVIDDCSTDNSVEQIESLLQQHNIEAHFIKNKVNKGICANLCQSKPGVKHSGGQLLFFYSE
jgi:glycosyltransferase involved in cell wall biosynthesis